MEATSPTTHHGAVSLTVLKSVLVISLWFLTFLSSISPIALRKLVVGDRNGTLQRQRNRMLMFSFVSCFGGGVFLATCLLDLVPDTIQALNTGLGELGMNLNGFPLPEFFIGFGFLMILSMEQIVVWYREQKQQSWLHEPEVAYPVDDAVARFDADGFPVPITIIRRGSYAGVRGQVGTLDSIGTSSDSFRPSGVAQRRSRSLEESLESAPGNANPNRRSVEFSDNVQRIIYAPYEIDQTDAPQSVRDLLDSEPELSDDELLQLLSDESISVHFNPESHSTLRAILLVAALSLHTLFEGRFILEFWNLTFFYFLGMALGLQRSSQSALQIFGALCIHKTIIGFSMGLRLVQSKMTIVAVVLCCFTFSTVMSLGAVIAIVISSETSASSGNVINGALQGIACGTFLYVTFFEVLPHELNPRGHRIWKFLFLLAGFSVMCIFILLYPSS